MSSSMRKPLSSSQRVSSAGSERPASGAPSILPPIERKLVVPKDPIQQFFDKRESEPNPFILPNEDVFVLRERERQEKVKKRQDNLKTKIWDKQRRERDTVAISHLRMAQQQLSTHDKDTKHDHIFQGRRKEKEHMTDFIAKKREMCLVQMSLDAFRQQIDSLGETAKLKEERLAKAEKMLEDDAVRFDTFLRENDRLTHEVIQKAEKATKDKLGKAMLLKQLIQEISQAEHEVERLSEQLQACEKYKLFLDAHTPPEFLEKHAKARAEREAARAAAEAAGEPVSAASEEELEEEEMYFREPEQLLALFSQLEERNLFLIQSVQDGEESLGELKQSSAAARHEATAEVAALDKSARVLQSRIAAEEARAAALRTDSVGHAEVASHEQLLSHLTALIGDTYKAVLGDAGTGSGAAQVEGPVEMLGKLEEALEGAVGEIRRFATRHRGLVLQLEREREGQRRAAVRAHKAREQEKQTHERLAVSLARAQAAVRPRVGKPMMVRSVPAVRKAEVKHDPVEDQDAEEHRVFFCE